MRIRNTGRLYTNGMGLTLASGAEAEVDASLGARLLRDYPGQIVEVPGPPPTPALSGHAPVGAEGVGLVATAPDRTPPASAVDPASESRDASLTTGSTSARTNEQPGSEPASRDSGAVVAEPEGPASRERAGRAEESTAAPQEDDRRATPREIPGVAPLEHEMPPRARPRRGRGR